ncbi:TPA: hypothetical protein RG892_000253 [Pseudomonas aeruginosa]|nr:hypothetical protein [Pseudomonas aeruginosa]
MVLGIAKEMADRFIEFVLKFFKGESAEDQLSKALKVSVLTIALLLFGLFALLSNNLNLRMDLADAEIGLAKINMLFDPTVGEGGPLKEFVRINDALSRQLDSVKNQNIILSKRTITATADNKVLKEHLLKVLEENKILQNNNQMLLRKCTQ